MGGDQAAGTLVDIKIKQLERSGKVLSEDDKDELFASVKATYEQQTDPRYGAARLWIDKIIEPLKTRQVLIRSLELAALNPEIPKFNVGLLQT